MPYRSGSKIIPAEFVGIYVLLLESRVYAYRVGFVVAIAGILLLVGTMASLRHTALKHNSACPDNAIAKVTEGTKVTCIMQRVYPGQVTGRMDPEKGWLDKLPRRSRKE